MLTYPHPENIHNYSEIYTHIFGRYNPSVRIIDLLSHTTYIVCVNFIHKRRVNSERQIFWESLHGNFIYSQSFCQKSTDFILFWSLVSGSKPGFTSKKPTRYPLDYGDFNYSETHGWKFGVELKNQVLFFLCVPYIKQNSIKFKLMWSSDLARKIVVRLRIRKHIFLRSDIT